jgi:signal transduction histidine kinase
VPERSRGRHSADRADFFAAPEVQLLGLGRDLFGRRKDGTEFPVEIGRSPLRTPSGQFVLASVIDLTARRRAEDGLRSSREELQLLTGRLLEAQEAERRRIARELHDDINQDLALLAVELDVLARTPPDSRTGERVRELSARVKELSSAVHDLSHQLHPAKLEHLGLVAAVWGLCREVTQHHDLDVKFTHFDVPAVRQATSLCLYRVAQEALRNVVKHGGTDRVTVELSGTADGLRLRVSDAGTGFDPGSAQGGGGLGLVSMRERLNLIGGEITIDSRPGGGTRIEARVPARSVGAQCAEAAAVTGDRR